MLHSCHCLRAHAGAHVADASKRCDRAWVNFPLIDVTKSCRLAADVPLGSELEPAGQLDGGLQAISDIAFIVDTESNINEGFTTTSPLTDAELAARANHTVPADSSQSTYTDCMSCNHDSDGALAVSEVRATALRGVSSLVREDLSPQSIFESAVVNGM